MHACRKDTGDPTLSDDLRGALSERPDAELHNALGIIESLRRRAPRPRILLKRSETLPVISTAPRLFLSPSPLRGGGWGEGFFLSFSPSPLRGGGRGEGSLPEIAAKLTLLHWRLHTLLAELTGDVHHRHEAALARPDLPPTRAALGCALGAAGRPADAVPHLRFAVESDPFDRPAARGALPDPARRRPGRRGGCLQARTSSPPPRRPDRRPRRRVVDAPCFFLPLSVLSPLPPRSGEGGGAVFLPLSASGRGPGGGVSSLRHPPRRGRRPRVLVHHRQKRRVQHRRLPRQRCRAMRRNHRRRYRFDRPHARNCPRQGRQGLRLPLDRPLRRRPQRLPRACHRRLDLLARRRRSH